MKRPAERAAVLAATSAPRGGSCLLVGAFWLAAPGAPVRMLGPAARARPGGHAAAGPVAYPAGGAVLTASALDVRTSGCSRGASGRAVIQSLSLLDGAVKARSVELDVRGGRIRSTSGVAGLSVTPGVAAVRTLRTTGQTPQAAALEVRLQRSRSGLVPGTKIVIGFALVPRKRAAVTHDEPLKVTPPLGLSGYVFPVVGEVAYGDTYGGFRGDVPGNWHHGDDIFAKLGAPVVAVASGTLNRVGWEKLGGWRLWVRDSLGNEFYYAHLAAYSPQALRSNRVTAGEVIGFIGNTGDAFTTWPHLHFEVHPHSLLHLGYNGAVDPTTYLAGWRHLPRIRAPRPAHPRFPRAAALRREASYVWRQLLVARGLVKHSPARKPQLPTTTTADASPVAAQPAAPAHAAIAPVTPRATSVTPSSSGHGGGLALWLEALLGSLGGAAVAAVALPRLPPSRRRRLPALATQGVSRLRRR